MREARDMVRHLFSLILTILLVLSLWEVALGGATVIHGSGEDYEDGYWVNVCTGETLYVSGYTKWRVNIAIEPDGVRGHYSYTANDFDVRAVGLTTGDVFKRVGAFHRTEHGEFMDPNMIQIMEVGGFVGPGPGNNFMVHWLSKLVINANGEVIMDKEVLWVECR